jgi:APA family basic amino acid/polyamine antiporter
VVYTEWIFFVALAVATFVLRRRSDYSPAYRTFGYPLVPLIFIAATALIVVNQIIAEPRNSAIGLLIVAAGLPVYALWARITSRKGIAIDAGH